MKPTIILIGALASLVLVASSRANVSITYDVPRDGRASLAIYNADGQLVRTLLTGRPTAKGRHTATWDRRDRYGSALPAGDYTWKLLSTEGLRAEFITQVGQNVNPVWEKATGNHKSPHAVAVNATGLYRLGSGNKGAHWSDEGGRLWRGQLVELRNASEPPRIHTWERAATWGRALYR